MSTNGHNGHQRSKSEVDLAAEMQERLSDLAEDLQPRIEEARARIKGAQRELGALNGRVIEFVKKHPAACLVGALAIGWLFSRTTRS